MGRQEGLSERSHEMMGNAGRGNIPCGGRPETERCFSCSRNFTRSLMWLGPSGLRQGGPHPHLPPHLGSPTGLQTSQRSCQVCCGPRPRYEHGGGSVCGVYTGPAPCPSQGTHDKMTSMVISASHQPPPCLQHEWDACSELLLCPLARLSFGDTTLATLCHLAFQ